MTQTLSVGPYRYTTTDAARTFGNLGPWWFELHRGLNTRFTETIGELMAISLTEGLRRGRDRRTGLGDELGQLGIAAGKAVATWTLSETEAHLAAMVGALRAAADALRDGGAFGGPTTGSVEQLNRSDGGVPKVAVDSVTVTHSGVSGDRQKVRYHHGRPWQALCLWSTEVIATLAAEGHPISAGSAGENVTISGLDWARIRPGVQLRIGEVLCEASLYTLPCKSIAQWFADGDFGRIHHQRGPVSRMYATVLEPGRIRRGDIAILEPTA